MTDTLFDQATRHHREGRLAQAEQVYQQILAANPAHAEAWGLLGLLALQAGHPAPAIDLLDHSLILRPDAPDVLGYRGLALKELGRHAEAVQALQEALRRKPGAFDLLYNLANTQRDGGLLEDAAATYRRALKRSPGSVDAHNNLGNTLRQLSRNAEAAASFRRAIALDPSAAPLHFNLGCVLDLAGDTEAAADSFRTAAQLSPQDPEPPLRLGHLLAAKKRHAEAYAAYAQSFAVSPTPTAAQHIALGRTLATLERLPEALAHLRQAAALAPELAETHTDLGTLLREMGDDAGATAELAEALRLCPGHALASYHLGIAHLLAGRLAAGWPLYERRMEAMTGFMGRFPELPWRGQPIPGQTLLLHAEQGLGDTLLFCRFIASAAESSQARIVLEVQPALRTMLAQLPGIDTILAYGEPLPPYDHHCALPSLPAAFATTLATIPAAPYLRADPARTEYWRHRLAQYPGRKIGLVWAGNIDYEHDAQRSLPPEALAALADIPDTTFISLQKDRGLAADFHPPPPIALDWTDELTDMAETASLIAALDLVIAADTALVHLAGALARPVWLLNRYHTEWRWLRDRTEDSPWYPTLRQFRQPAVGDWSSVLANIRAALTG